MKKHAAHLNLMLQHSMTPSSRQEIIGRSSPTPSLWPMISSSDIQCPTTNYEFSIRALTPVCSTCLTKKHSGVKLAENCSSLKHPRRSEEHTSELQLRPHLVCRLLLEKKKQ